MKLTKEQSDKVREFAKREDEIMRLRAELTEDINKFGATLPDTPKYGDMITIQDIATTRNQWLLTTFILLSIED